MLDLGTLIDQLGSWVASHLAHIAVTLVVSAWAGPPIADLATHFFDGVARALGLLAAGLHERLVASVSVPGRARDGINGLFSAPFFWPWRALRGAIRWLWSKVLLLPGWNPEFVSIPDTIYGAVLDAVTPRVMQGAGGLAQAYDGTMGNLRSKGDGRGVGQPIVGAILLGGAVLAFLYADIVIGLETFWAAFYGRELPLWATVMPEWLRDPATGHVVASTVTALALGFLIFDLLGITHLNDNLSGMVSARRGIDEKGRPHGWPTVLMVSRWALVLLAVALIAAVVIIVFKISYWRAQVVAGGGFDQIPPDAHQSLLDGLAWTIPVMVLSTGLIGVSVTTLPVLLWLIVVGLLRIVFTIAGAIVQGLGKIRPVITPLFRVIVLLSVAVFLIALMLGAVGLLTLWYAGLLFVPVAIVGVAILALLATGVVLWIAGELAALGLYILGGMRFDIRLGVGATEIEGIFGLLGGALRWVLKILARPILSIYNWLCEFEVVRRMHLRPVHFSDDPEAQRGVGAPRAVGATAAPAGAKA